jgi:hypothetical protein
MKYQYEEKQTNAIDGSKTLPFDCMNAEMFYPTWQENIDSTPVVKVMAAEEVAPAVIEQIIDLQKALLDYATAAAVDGKFSWGQMSEEEHLVSKGKHATNDPAESPFAQLTRQLQCFGRVLGIHASAVGHARINGDFKQLSSDERQSLLAYALCASPAVRREEKMQLNAQ